MKKLYFLFLFPVVVSAQVTIRVTSIPSNTPAGADVYIAGSINTWNPGNPGYILQPDGLGNRQIVIAEGSGTAEFKFTRGSWGTVEGNATGGYLPNRTFTFTGAPQTITLTIQSWEDTGGTGTSTAAANVQVMSGAFYMPQLDRSRRIWLYLPPDYNTTTKTYPVLYMQDGQNLFDNMTSFAGEWQVDETLNALFADGDYGAIVVGIDNGGADRLDEYSPWVNPDYGGGDGDDYMAFLAETLKPYIDANYRTRPEAAMNALIGSSMGGLIATYGASEHPEAFRKIGSMSPAYWFASSAMESYFALSEVSLDNHRIYFVAGTNEDTDMVPDILSVKSEMIANGLYDENAHTKFDTYGTHTESYWRGEFGALYQWLFAEENLSTDHPAAVVPKIMQNLSGKLFVEGIPVAADFEIVNMLGATVGRIQLSDGLAELPDNLPKGVYLLHALSASVKPVRVIQK